MKTKVLLTLAILAFSFSVVQSQVSFGILGGLNLSNITGKNDGGTKLENDLLTGFHAGVNVQIPIAPEFYFQPGLLFSTKGTKWTEEETATLKSTYLELPLNLVYKGSLGKGYVLVGFGPYVAFGLGGELKVGTEEYDVKFKNTVTEGDPEAWYFKTLDIGGNIFAGYQMGSGLFIQLNTQLGLVNINPEYEGATSNEEAWKNTGFGLSLGYRF